MEDEDRLMRVGDVPDEDREEQLPAEPELPQPDGPDEGLLPDEDEEPDSPEVGRPFPFHGLVQRIRARPGHQPRRSSIGRSRVRASSVASDHWRTRRFGESRLVFASFVGPRQSHLL